MEDKEQITATDSGLLVRAPAKLNLTLLIAGKRPDGYHEIETVMAKINWYDEVIIAGGGSGIELICEGPHWAPVGPDNTVWRACEAILKEAGRSAGIKVTLKKNIPAGTGLGSASSDAAATLIGVNRLLGLGFTKERLAEMAAAIGSDVPFFLGGPLAFCTGRGEKIENLGKIFDFSAILAIPDISVSTKKVYENYAHNQALFNELHGKINGLLSKKRVDLAARMCANMLQNSCFKLYRELAELKAGIEALGIGPVCLSGSGSSMYCIFDGNLETAGKYQSELNGIAGCKSIIVSNNRW